MYVRYKDIFLILFNLSWKKLGGRNWKIAPTEYIARNFQYFFTNRQSKKK